jgi:hypothetical protein
MECLAFLVVVGIVVAAVLVVFLGKATAVITEDSALAVVLGLR